MGILRIAGGKEKISEGRGVAEGFKRGEYRAKILGSYPLLRQNNIFNMKT
jgi:hypothetical protein